MLYACFTPIALCFVYTSWHFSAFSGTNLLTRCHSARSCFLLFLCFKKVTHEIFSKLDEMKDKVLIYLTRRRSPKERRRRTRRRPHHRVVWAIPWPRHQVVWAPGPPPDIALPPIYYLQGENSKSMGVHPQKVLQRHRHRRQSSGDRSLCSGTLPGWGIAPKAISIDSTAISNTVVVSYDEEGVVLPRGLGLYQ
jgi:hypothetical protein